MKTNKIAEMIEEIKLVQVDMEPSKHGDYTLALKKESMKKYVLSKYHPREGAKKLLAQEEEILLSTLWVIIGFGMGYLIDEIQRQVNKEALIIVIEPNSVELKKQMDYRTDTNWSRLKGLSIFTGTEFNDLAAIFEQKANGDNYNDIRLIIHSGYEDLYKCYCNQVVKILSDKRRSLLVNYNTLNNRAGDMVRNIIENKVALQKSYDFSYYKNAYQGIPALIVSAGPSLSKNIEHIKKFNGLIFSSGRTIKAIEEQGKKPHFLAIIDSQENIYKTFEGRIDNDYPLITTVGAYSGVIKKSQGPKYFVSNINNQTGADLYQIKLEELDIGGTVASLCFDAAYYMGCNPIILIGQDLAYTDMKTYAEGEQFVNANFTKESELLVKAYNGGEIQSDVMFQEFINWFEQYIDNHPDRTYINATEGGAAIKGTCQKTFKEVVETYQNGISKELFHQPLEIHSEQIEDTLSKRKKELEEIAQLSIQGNNIMKALEQEYIKNSTINPTQVNKLINELEQKVDCQLRKYSDIKLLGLLREAYYNKLSNKSTINDEYSAKDIEKIHQRMKLYQATELASNEIVSLIKSKIK